MRRWGLRIGLLGAMTLLSFGCAQILGADFDKPFQPPGAGGAGGATVSTIVSATAAGTGTGGTGGAGGAGGAPTVDCDLSSTNLTDTVDIHVWAKDVLSPGDGAEDFFTSTATSPVPAGAGYTHDLGAYKLYSAPDPGNRVLLYQCPAEGHRITDEPMVNCECIGYAVQILGSSMLDKTKFAPLTRIVGKVPESNALILEDVTSATTCSTYGNSLMGPMGGCTTEDMFYGAL